jgi:hypothetical protein
MNAICDGRRKRVEHEMKPLRTLVVAGQIKGKRNAQPMQADSLVEHHLGQAIGLFLGAQGQTSSEQRESAARGCCLLPLIVRSSIGSTNTGNLPGRNTEPRRIWSGSGRFLNLLDSKGAPDRTMANALAGRPIGNGNAP